MRRPHDHEESLGISTLIKYAAGPGDWMGAVRDGLGTIGGGIGTAFDQTIGRAARMGIGQAAVGLGHANELVGGLGKRIAGPPASPIGKSVAAPSTMGKSLPSLPVPGAGIGGMASSLASNAAARENSIQAAKAAPISPQGNSWYDTFRNIERYGADLRRSGQADLASLGGRGGSSAVGAQYAKGQRALSDMGAPVAGSAVGSAHGIAEGAASAAIPLPGAGVAARAAGRGAKAVRRAVIPAAPTLAEEFAAIGQFRGAPAAARHVPLPSSPTIRQIRPATPPAPTPQPSAASASTIRALPPRVAPASRTGGTATTMVQPQTSVYSGPTVSNTRIDAAAPPGGKFDYRVAPEVSTGWLDSKNNWFSSDGTRGMTPSGRPIPPRPRPGAVPVGAGVGAEGRASRPWMPPPRAPLENTPSGNWRTPEGLKLDPNGRILGFGGGGPSASIPGATASGGSQSAASLNQIASSMANPGGGLRSLPGRVFNKIPAPVKAVASWEAASAGFGKARDVIENNLDSAAGQYAKGYAELTNPAFTSALQHMNPEEAHTALAEKLQPMLPQIRSNLTDQNVDVIKQIAGQDGKLSPNDVAQFLNMPGGAQVQTELGPQKAFSLFQNMEPMQAALLAIGVPLAVMGLFQSFGGSGGLGSLLTMILGGGAAAYGLGAFDEAPKAPQRNDDLFHQTQVALSDRPEAAEAQDALAYQNYGRLGVPAARAYRMFNPEGLKDMIRQKAKDELARRASQLDM